MNNPTIQMVNKYDDEPMVIFTGTAWQAGLVKDFLEESGIEAYFRDEMMGSFNPWWSVPGGTSNVKVMTSGRNYRRAMDLIRQYERENQND